VIALLSFTTSGSWIVPLLLIGAGLFMLVRSGVVQLPQAGTAAPTSATRDPGDYLTTVPERPPLSTPATGASSDRASYDAASGDAASSGAAVDDSPAAGGSSTGAGTESDVLAEFDEPRPDEPTHG